MAEELGLRNNDFKRIGELAREAGVPVSTVRYYTEIGILNVAGYTPGGYRLYRPEEKEKIIMLKQARGHHLKLAEIKEIIAEHREKGVQKS